MNDLILQLARLENLQPKARKVALAELESQGYALTWTKAGYLATRDGERWHPKPQKCDHCGTIHPMSKFIGHTDFLMPWCASCHAADPAGAKLANDRARSAKRYQEAEPDEKLQRHRQRLARRKEDREARKSLKGQGYLLAIAAIEQVDLSAYDRAERKAIEEELHNAIMALKSMEQGSHEDYLIELASLVEQIKQASETSAALAKLAQTRIDKQREE